MRAILMPSLTLTPLGLPVFDADDPAVAPKAALPEDSLTPGWLAPGFLIVGLLMLVASSMLLPMFLIGLLAMAGLVAGAVAVGLALALLPATEGGSLAWPSRWCGAGLIILGSMAMPVILFFATMLLGGRGTPPAPTATIVSFAALSWMVDVVGLGLGIRLRGTDRRSVYKACFLMLGVLPLVLTLGSFVWPVLPKSL